MRFFFITSWGNNTEQQNTCFYVFKSMTAFLSKLMKIKPEDWTDSLYSEGIRAFADDIERHVYASWINRLSQAAVVVCSSTARGHRLVEIPPTQWCAACAKDQLISDLETLYAKYLPLATGTAVVMVRLNGDRITLAC
jgi:hypothetical protein